MILNVWLVLRKLKRVDLMANISTIRTTEAEIKSTDFYMANIFSSSGEKG